MIIIGGVAMENDKDKSLSTAATELRRQAEERLQAETVKKIGKCLNE